ncbi:hypothetical protein [Pseudofrankia sp. DC12]|nr:hypothetical protein [Pseudofrankia sp. DC12]
MAIAFAAVLVGLQVAVLLDAADIIGLRPQRGDRHRGRGDL